MTKGRTIELLDIVFNPAAARGKAVRALKTTQQILSQKNIPFTVHPTSGRKHAINLTQELIANGSTTIVAMGGDGTIHEVLNGFSNFENVNMGIIPCGSGNDFVRSVGVPVDTKAALDIILNGSAKFTDFMQLDNVRGINVVGTGIDVDVLQRCKKFKIIKGKLQYFLSLLISVFAFKNYPLTTKYNNKEEEKSALIACVCNGKDFGGGIKICPEADVSDGLLNYVVVFNIKMAKRFGALLKLMKGKILQMPQTVHEKVKQVEVTSSKNFVVNVDGELYPNLAYNVHIVSNKLKIYRP